MKWISLHCDTLMLSYMFSTPDIVKLEKAHVDVERMKQAENTAQFFAIFMPPPGAEKFLGRTEPIDDAEYIDYTLKAFHATMEKAAADIAPAYSAADIEANEKAGKLSGLLTFEDGRPVDGSLDKLKAWYDKGIRLISLTWNAENCFGFPNSADPEVMAKGLKPFGIEAIGAMAELGIIVDVSHLSDGGFWDVVKYAKKPFVASHSNCRAICDVPRNLTDDMLRALAEKGGVSGINFGPEFLNEDPTCKDSTVASMSAHIRRMIQLGGEGLPAIGTDFDGISGNLEVDSVDKMGLLFDQLHRDGLSDDVIEKVAYKNAMRVIRESMA